MKYFIQRDIRYMSCMLAWAAEKDIDWAVWALTGVYYFREGKRGVVEAYGMLDANWHHVHNHTYLQRLSVIQPSHKGIDQSCFAACKLT